MYTECYIRRMETTGWGTLERAPDTRPTPPEQVATMEEDSVFERLLREAVTPEEHLLILLIEELLDEAWRLNTGKGLRGELRRMFKGRGLSDRRFYTAFHSVEKRFIYERTV